MCCIQKIVEVISTNTNEKGKAKMRMKKFGSMLLASTVLLATLSVPVFATDNNTCVQLVESVVDTAESDGENCLMFVQNIQTFLSEKLSILEQKVRNFLGLEQNVAVDDATDCEDCSFNVDSLETQVWLTYIGDEYYQFELTPVAEGLKDLKVKRLNNLKKAQYIVPNIRDVQIYGTNIYIISSNDNLLCLSPETGKMKNICEDVSCLKWLKVNGNNVLTYVTKDGQVKNLEA